MTHSVCAHCRDTVCSLESRCSECKDWPLEIMSEYRKHKKSLATKREKKPAVAAASVSAPPAVESSPLIGFPPSFPSISDDSKIRDAVLAVLQSLSKPGSVGIHPISVSAPSTVPNYTPSVAGVTGGDGGKKPHNVGSLSRTSGVGALEYQSAVATPPFVHHDFPYVSQPSDWSAQVLVSAAPVAAPLGHPPIPLASYSTDQLRVPGSGPLDSASSALSPTSLLFPLPLSAASASSSLPDLPPFTSFSSASTSSFGLALPSSSSSSFLHSFSLVFCFVSFFLFGYFCSSSSCVVSSSLPFPPPGSSSFPPSFSESSSSSVLFVPPPSGFPLSSSYASRPSFFPAPLPSSSFPSSSFASSPYSVLPVPPPPLESVAFFLRFGRLPGAVVRSFSCLPVVGSGGTDFAGVVRSSFPHLPDLA